MIRLIAGIILICTGQWLAFVWTSALDDFHTFRVVPGNLHGQSPLAWWLSNSTYYKRVAALMPIDVNQVDSKEKAAEAYARNSGRLRTLKYLSYGVVLFGIGMALSSRWRLEPSSGGYGSPGAGSPSPHR